MSKYTVTDLCLWSRILSFTKIYLTVKASEIFNNNLYE
jgi:hypothetical protein